MVITAVRVQAAKDLRALTPRLNKPVDEDQKRQRGRHPVGDIGVETQAAKEARQNNPCGSGPAIACAAHGIEQEIKRPNREERGADSAQSQTRKEHVPKAGGHKKARQQSNGHGKQLSRQQVRAPHRQNAENGCGQPEQPGFGAEKINQRGFDIDVESLAAAILRIEHIHVASLQIFQRIVPVHGFVEVERRRNAGQLEEAQERRQRQD